MLVHLPGQKENKTCDLPVMSFDLLPTLADLCNAPVDGKAELDGMSLKPALTGKNPPALAARDLFWHKASQRPTSTGDYVSTAIRSGRYKLLDFYQQNRIQLLHQLTGDFRLLDGQVMVFSGIILQVIKLRSVPLQQEIGRASCRERV